MFRLRPQYVAVFAKFLKGKEHALFFQLDKKLALPVELQMALEIPFVEF